jgi:23S rRNA (pseudouridine1915-N3)-methyltransferase
VKLKVLWFGRPAASPYEEQVAIYRRRVSHRWQASDVALRPVAGGRAEDPQRVLRREAEAILSHRDPSWPLLVLDERGTARDSQAFARWLAGFEDGGLPGLTFVVGSDLGLHADVVAEANHRISLSAMTLPHQVARLVLWEQLYRSTSILTGGAYHRVCVQ